MESLMITSDYFILNKHFGVIIDYYTGSILYVKKSFLHHFHKYNKADIEQLENAYNKNFSKLLPNNLNIVLVPSYMCNMKCQYCYESLYSKNNFCLTNNHIRSIINAIEEYFKRQHYNYITFTLLGGEPLLDYNIHWFNNFFMECNNRNLIYDIFCITNGLNLNDLFDKCSFKISGFQLTIDGDERIHNQRRPSKDKKINSFNRVIGAIDFLVEKNIYLDIRINIDLNNINALGYIINLFYEKQLHINNNVNIYVYPVTYYPISAKKNSELEIFKTVLCYLKTLSAEKRFIGLDFHGREFIDSLLLNKLFIPKFWFCGVSTNQLVFDSNGNISACWWGADTEAFRIGVFDEKKYTFYHWSLEKLHNRTVMKLHSCKSCKYKYICGTGCAFKAVNRKNFDMKGHCSDFYHIIKLYIQFLFFDISRSQIKTKKEIKHPRFKYLSFKHLILTYDGLFIKVSGNSMFLSSQKNIWAYVSIAKNYNIGDIVLYLRGYDLLVHRIVCKNHKFYLLKGDNENYIEEIHERCIIAKVNGFSVGKTFDCTVISAIKEYCYDSIKFRYHLKSKFLYKIEAENV